MTYNSSGARGGFTLIEVVITTIVIGILAGITYVSYNGMQERAATSAVQDSLRAGGELLEINYTRKRDYPPNFADTEFVANDNVAIALWTNATQVRVHDNLTPLQNGQLFLNTCNANLPFTSGGHTLDNCRTTGNVKLQIHATGGANVQLDSPFSKAQLVAAFSGCSTACQAIGQAVIDQFESQGGTWPIHLSKTPVSLPEPELVNTGNATKFCLEGRSSQYSGVVGHIKSGDSAPTPGPCPDDPELHYP